MNPFKSPSNSAQLDPYTTVVKVGENTVSVYGEMVPAFFPLLGKYLVSVNGQPPVTSNKIGWQEKIEFPLVIDGHSVEASFKTHNFEFGRQPFKILVDGDPLVESSVKMKRWWPSFIISILIGMVIAGLGMRFLT